MKTRSIAAAALGLCAGLCATAIQAQPQIEARPLSAIDWLSGVVENPGAGRHTGLSAVAQSATAPRIETSSLGAPSLDAVGLVPATVSGLDADFWGNSSSARLTELIAGLRTDLPSPLARLLQTILLAELPPPVDSTGAARVFLARIDRLLRQGALDQAQALLDRAGTDSPALFARSFDISLLSEDSVTACARILDDDRLRATVMAQIFCLMRAGNWQEAEQMLADAETTLTATQTALLARFVTPETAEGAPVLAVPERITPLIFRLHQAIGEPLGTATLPNAFAYSALSQRSGWKARITAAERLVRSNAIPDAKLLAIYSERPAAASGGIWDRVEAVQALERAIKAGDRLEIDVALPRAISAMRRARLEPALANLFAKPLLDMALDGPSAQRAVRLGLMSDQPATLRDRLPDTPSYLAAPPAPEVAAILTGDLAGITSTDQTTQALLRGFRASSAGDNLDNLIADGNRGQAVLEAIELLQDGVDTAPDQLEQGIAALRLTGFERTARAMGLSLLLSEPDR